MKISPCVIGQKSGTKEPLIILFDPDSRTLTHVQSSNLINKVAVGLKMLAAGDGPVVYQTGGEIHFGRSQWITEVAEIDLVRQRRRVIARLQRVRRHHAAAITNSGTRGGGEEKLAILGGFGEHRELLADGEMITTSGESHSLPELPAGNSTCFSPLYSRRNQIQTDADQMDQF